MCTSYSTWIEFTSHYVELSLLFLIFPCSSLLWFPHLKDIIWKFHEISSQQHSKACRRGWSESLRPISALRVLTHYINYSKCCLNHIGYISRPWFRGLLDQSPFRFSPSSCSNIVMTIFFIYSWTLHLLLNLFKEGRVAAHNQALLLSKLM